MNKLAHPTISQLCLPSSVESILHCQARLQTPVVPAGGKNREVQTCVHPKPPPDTHFILQIGQPLAPFRGAFLNGQYFYIRTCLGLELRLRLVSNRPIIMKLITCPEAKVIVLPQFSQETEAKPVVLDKGTVIDALSFRVFRDILHGRFIVPYRGIVDFS